MQTINRVPGTPPVLDPLTGDMVHHEDFSAICEDRIRRMSKSRDGRLHTPNRRERRGMSATEYRAFRGKHARMMGGQTNGPTAAAIPFVGSAHEHTEPVPVITQALVAAAGPATYEFNLPSYGYVRHLWLDVNVTGGAGGVLSGDAPFNVIDQVTFLDTNGAPIFGPLGGFRTFLSNLYGGYAYKQDPRDLALYATAVTGYRFQIRIPIELSHHDATGCLGNQNSSAPYRIRFNINAPTSIYSTVPTTYPTVTITPVLEAWSLPNSVDAMGRPQAQLPPNYGTIQYWSERVVTGVPTGNFTVPVLRVGNLIRNLIFECRDTSSTGTRDDAVFPTQPILNWDARQLYNESTAHRQTRSQEILESGSTNGRPAGVYAYSFARTNQDRAGDDKPWLWLPTVEATRLELTGSFTAAGVVTVLVNDVAPGEVNPTQRYVENNATGFHPNADVPNPNQP